MNDAIRMQISAFVDGELPDNEADLLLRRMGQDVELRQKVAEYLAIGRVMRGESSLSGAERIHERVSAEIDDKPLAEPQEIAQPPAARAIRPLAGIAIAASVALLAIFGLQQSTGVDGTQVVPQTAILADTAEEASYTAPEEVDDQLRQYYLSHGATATENGANSMNSRLVTLRLREQVLDDSPEDDAQVDEQETGPAEVPTEP